MHGDVEQEGLYKNSEFHYFRGRDFAPPGRGHTWYVVHMTNMTKTYKHIRVNDIFCSVIDTK
jgi:hypothetical protein